MKIVGKNETKIDGYSLACGKAEFTDDIELKDLQEIKFLWSPHAHAKIKKIDISKAEKLPGVSCVLCYKNVPRVAHTTAGQGFPEPSPYDAFMFDNKVRFVGDRVAAVAAESEEIANEALQLIKVDYEILPAIFDPRDALKENAPIIHDEPEAHMPIPVFYDAKRNYCAHTLVKVGDTKKGFNDADKIVEGEYETHYATHCPIEPHITIAYIDQMGRLIIRTSTQVPFHVRRIVAQCLEIPEAKIRVVKPRIGGGFGGKQEILLEDVAAMAAYRTKKPVRIKYDRSEEFISARTRHPQIINLKMGAKKDGTITAIDMNCLMNTGAYGSHCLTVLCNTGSKTLPLYKCDNISFEGKTVYTNLPVGGAYRGYGATQGYFAFGCLIDELCEKIGMDPVEFYYKNHIQAGEGSPVFEALGEGREGVEMKLDTCGLDECIRIGAEEIKWKEKREEALQNRKLKNKNKKSRGVGMVCLMQGSSIPEIDMASAMIKMNDDGSFNLLMGATDIGTGSDTILAQIAAEVLCVPLSKMIVHSSDTDFTPFDTGAYASSTTYLSGNAVRKAAETVRGQILKVAAEILQSPTSDLCIKDCDVYLPNSTKKVSYSEICKYALYGKNQFQISAIESHVSHKSPPPFSAHFAEVEVDEETGFVTILNYISVIDCGTAINPILAAGQNDGAVVNGISYAMTERYIFDQKGRMLNPNFDYYKIYSTADMKNIKTIIVPNYEPTGPFGAKSVSEIGINGPMPAIANAIANACGIRLRKAPFTPEKVLEQLKKR